MNKHVPKIKKVHEDGNINLKNKPVQRIISYELWNHIINTQLCVNQLDSE
jgi:hypothetical protein